MSVGRGALLTKLDVRNTFWLIPVSPDDWRLLGIHWQNQYYFEKMLPFGLRSSPFIFNQVAEAVECILRHQFAIPIIMHYLDDYLSVPAPSLSLASKQRSIIEEAFIYLGIPLALEKLEGPVTELTFLGITLNSDRFEARLPDDKLADIKQLVLDASSTRSIPAAKFVSLLGKLTFAAQFIVPVCTFMRRLWDTAKKFSKVPRHYRITLSSDCRKDLLWWQEFLASWNGKWFFLYQAETSSTVDLDLLQV